MQPWVFGGLGRPGPAVAAHDRPAGIPLFHAAVRRGVSAAVLVRSSGGLPLRRFVLLLSLLAATVRCEAAPTDAPLLEASWREPSALLEAIGSSRPVRALLEGPLAGPVRSLEAWRRARAGLALASRLLGVDARRVADAALGGEGRLWVDLTAEGPRFAIEARMRDETSAARLAELLADVLDLALDPRSRNDRDTLVDAAGRFALRRVGATVRYGNLIDTVLSGRAGDDAPGPSAALALRVHLDTLRRTGWKMGGPPSEEPLAVLLFAPYARSLDEAHILDLRLERADGAARLTARWDETPGTAPAWAAPEGPPPPRIDGPAIAALSLKRDFGLFVRERDHWADPALEAGFLEFANAVQLFFGGRSLTDDVLPALGPGATLLVTPRRLEEGAPRPKVLLPAFTLVVPIDATRLPPAACVSAFQTLIGIVNAERAQNGEPTFVLDRQDERGAVVATATFLEDPPDQGSLPLRANFQPALAIFEGHLVLSSSLDGVRTVLDGLAPAARGEAWDRLEVDIGRLARALASNRESFVLDRMLSEGETRREAEAVVDGLIGLLRTGGRLVVETGRRPEAVTVHVSYASQAAAGEDS